MKTDALKTVILTLVALFFTSIVGYVIDHFMGTLSALLGGTLIATAVISIPIAIVIDLMVLDNVRSGNYAMFGLVYVVVFFVLTAVAFGLISLFGLGEVLPF